ncbi:helix-turn-helix domain-containing protein [Streptomyces synnematoformans]|uniref:Helix-turn-helix domain-containing protein n=1 Tax=Streptomyces synnematoformans TaxID=415721 RepID=A0ABP5J350_9ACTN
MTAVEPPDDGAQARGLDAVPEVERPWSTPGPAAGTPPSSTAPTVNSRKGRGGRPRSADRERSAPDSADRLLTVGEVAAWLRVSQASVRNKYRLWGIPPQKVGRLLRFRARDVTRYLDKHYG